ncbi:anti-phage dCTP deaminase [Thiorhodovibrio frisius]|uniref:Deoxycytidylate deaminase n=1 Tax=Thiorhodovibrio frisius TaxID=631362 RepID=H8YYX0_9GAMM|nr:anti-phage dCTP deaminase [Thiorhodovibrio frisius]EIC23646.1 deoxycytidylate deaminase [Thiorhodovibrio frisius]WPL23263.1 deoxycytidylate deaminase [Thiorhodovibrio frisius]
MKSIFTGTYDELKQKLSSINGEWDENQANKKVLRLNGGVMNWFSSTGTIQFQGKDEPKEKLKDLVLSCLDPNHQQQIAHEPIELVEIDDAEGAPEDSIPYSERVGRAYLIGAFENSEIVIGLVSAVGTETTRVVTPLKDRLSHFGYAAIEIKVSSLLKTNGTTSNEYERIKSLMEAGDKRRKDTKLNSILAYAAAKLISDNRDETKPKRAYIINSLKHPDEVEALRKIYGQGFYLFGVHADKKRRLHYLTNDKNLTDPQAIELTDIDEDEKVKHGQRTRDTFHLADFYINFGKNDDQVKNTIQRFLELIFAHPYKNPTFDEFAMFMAFSSSVRSGDLSRQVGAVIARNDQILSTGANETPKQGGGLYWANVDDASGKVIDEQDGKDYTRNEDSNKVEQQEILSEIMRGVKKVSGLTNDQTSEIEIVLNHSRIRDLTEFGRVVHAEMEAILSCSRAGISTIDGTLYCTTFPCHNCAKHIIAAGIQRVVYVEPYPKSKALEFHSDSIELRTKLETDEKDESNHVIFEPFTGVGARRFLDFFSMNLGAGIKLTRKGKDGKTVDWTKGTANVRVALLPESYREIESDAAEIFQQSLFA